MGNNHKRLYTPQGTQVTSGEPDLRVIVSDAVSSLEIIDPAELTCLEFLVVLKIADKERVSRGGIILSPAETDKALFASCKAQIVSHGAECWLNGDGTPLANRPKVGDKVLIAKYAGLTFRDKEYNLYRFAHDKDVVAVVKGEK